MVTLQGNPAALGFGKDRHSSELAMGDAVAEILAAQHVIKVLARAVFQ
jgi:uncharacterized protein with PIN domain